MLSVLVFYLLAECFYYFFIPSLYDVIFQTSDDLHLLYILLTFKRDSLCLLFSALLIKA